MNEKRTLKYLLLIGIVIITLAASLQGASASQPDSLRGAAAAKLPPIMLKNIYVTGAGFGHAPTANFVSDQWGLTVASSTDLAGFVIPRPADWDTTTPFTVTLYFALPVNLADTILNWRLVAGGAQINLPQGSAQTGWDGLYPGNIEDGTPFIAFNAGGHFDLMKSQSWTAKWSSTYNTWYFGAGVNTANDFIGNPIWNFAFRRGFAVGNGETYADEMIIVGAEVTYWSLPAFYTATYMPITVRP